MHRYIVKEQGVKQMNWRRVRLVTQLLLEIRSKAAHVLVQKLDSAVCNQRISARDTWTPHTTLIRSPPLERCTALEASQRWSLMMTAPRAQRAATQWRRGRAAATQRSSCLLTAMARWGHSKQVWTPCMLGTRCTTNLLSFFSSRRPAQTHSSGGSQALLGGLCTAALAAAAALWVQWKVAATQISRRSHGSPR